MNMFDTAISRLLSNEGGYTEGAGDPGGETAFGISKRSYPDVDIKNLTRDEAVAIYHRDFWTPIEGESLPFAVGYQLLDFAVNSGIQTAIRALQRALSVASDGNFGPRSLTALKTQSVTDTMYLLLAERLEFMTGLRNWDQIGRAHV